jgi:GNAT superfamily N-acetyltransferase
MFETRVATEADAALIAGHRSLMFAEMGHGDERQLREMAEAFIPWVRERLRDGRYLGWLVQDEEAVVAGAGLWLMDFPPHWRDPQPLRAYLLNFYVAPEARGRGLARDLLQRAVEEARQHGVRVISLHASNAGRPIYEQYGFEATTEMMLL